MQHFAPLVTAMLHHKVNKQTNHCHETHLGNQGFLAKDPCYCHAIAWQKSLQSYFTTTANKQTNITKIKELSCHSSLCAFHFFRIQLFWSKSGSRSRPFFISGSGFNMDPGDMEKILTFELLDGFSNFKKVIHSKLCQEFIEIIRLMYPHMDPSFFYLDPDPAKKPRIHRSISRSGSETLVPSQKILLYQNIVLGPHFWAKFPNFRLELFSTKCANTKMSLNWTFLELQGNWGQF